MGSTQARILLPWSHEQVVQVTQRSPVRRHQLGSCAWKASALAMSSHSVPHFHWIWRHLSWSSGATHEESSARYMYPAVFQASTCLVCSTSTGLVHLSPSLVQPMLR